MTLNNTNNWSPFLTLVDSRARDAVTAVELPAYEQRVVLGLFVSTWEVFRGVKALIERYLAEEAPMLSRTLLEDTARLMWLARDPNELESRVIRFGLTSAKYAKSVANAARANGWAWADEMFEERENEIVALRGAAAQAGLGSEPDDFPKTWELLGDLKQRRLDYWYARASQSVHSTIIGISARMPPSGKEGESAQILLRSSLDETARVGIMAAEFFMRALHAASRVLPWVVIESSSLPRRCHRSSSGCLGPSPASPSPKTRPTPSESVVHQ
jgi:hypothetical protein